MSNPRRYLLRSLIFLLLVAIVVGVLHGVIWRAFNHNPFLNGLILATLALGIVYNIRRILQLRPELAWIEDYRAGALMQEPPRLCAPLVKALGEHERRGETVLSAVSSRFLLDSLSSRLDESRDTARYLTGLLIFLGLLGTFWGLLESINAVGLVISGLTVGGGDIETLFNEMKTGLARPLNGMGTAFSSSLFGLSGSLVLGFLELQANQAQNAFYNDLEEWLSSISHHGVTRADPVGQRGQAPAVNQPLPAYLQGLMQQTVENLDAMQNSIGWSNDLHRELTGAIQAMTQQVALLGDRLEQEGAYLARLSRVQEGIAERLDQQGTSGDGSSEAMRDQLRAIERQLARMIEEQAQGRERTVRELRGELRVVARTIAAAAGDPKLIRD